MSLDVYLKTTEECPNCGHRVGSGNYVFDANITHNLGRMADEAGIYYACWRPEEMVNEAEMRPIRVLEEQGQWSDARAMRAKLPRKPIARDLIDPLRRGLADLRARPEHYKQFNAENGWGLYEHFVPWVERYLAACETNPDALVEVSR